MLNLQSVNGFEKHAMNQNLTRNTGSRIDNPCNVLIGTCKADAHHLSVQISSRNNAYIDPIIGFFSNR